LIVYKTDRQKVTRSQSETFTGQTAGKPKGQKRKKKNKDIKHEEMPQM